MLRGIRGLTLLVSVLALALAIGCGGSRKPATVAGDPASGDDCEPGRCMPDISQRIDDRRPAARACYEAGHERDATLQGSLVVNFEIDPEGTVVDASQSMKDDQIMDVGVVDCVTAIIRQITFAKSQRGKSTRAFHRYEFSPP